MLRALSVSAITIIFAMCSTVSAVNYCYDTAHKWTRDVPVFVVTSGAKSVAYTGLPTTTVVAYTKAAIQQWNEAAGGNISVWYAGEQSDFPHHYYGVTIFVPPCSDDRLGEREWVGLTHRIQPNVVGIRLHRASGCDWIAPWGVTPVDTPDLQSVIAHELGHALGLDHPARCHSQGQGIMLQGLTGTGQSRWLHRYDIEALNALYGTRSRTIRYRTSYDGINWTPESTLGTTATPISATDPNADPNGEPHAIVWAAMDNRVKFRSHNNNTWGAVETVDTSATGKTWHTPAVARGDGAWMVAWIYEPVDDIEGEIWYALRTDGGQWVSFCPGNPITHRALGLTWSADQGVYLLTYVDIDNQPSVYTVLPDGSRRPTVINKSYHDFGDSVCEHGADGWCQTAMATSGKNGPCLGGALGWISPFASHQYYFIFDFNECYPAYGRNGLTRDQRSSSAGYVGSFTQTDSSGQSWVYHRSGAFPPIDHLVPMYTDYWPIGVGAYTKSGQVYYRAYYAY